MFRMSSRCASVVAILAAWLGIVGQAEAQRDDTTTVLGKLVGASGNKLAIDTGIEQIVAVTVDRSTELKVRAPASADLLIKGAIVEVSGDVSADYVIDKPRITVYVNGVPAVRSSGGAYYNLKAERETGKVPIILIGTIIETEPLRIKGNNSITSQYYFADEVGSDGIINNWHSIPTINRIFQVNADKNGERIYADLGGALQLAGERPEVTTYVDSRTQVARTVFINRDKPVELDELTGKKKGKSKPTRTAKPKPEKPGSDAKKETGKEKESK